MAGGRVSPDQQMTFDCSGQAIRPAPKQSFKHALRPRWFLEENVPRGFCQEGTTGENQQEQTHA